MHYSPNCSRADPWKEKNKRHSHKHVRTHTHTHTQGDRARDRERKCAERGAQNHSYTHTITHTHTHTERERERERERDTEESVAVVARYTKDPCSSWATPALSRRPDYATARGYLQPQSARTASRQCCLRVSRDRCTATGVA